MTTVFILFILAALIGYGLKEYYQVKLGVGPHGSPANVVNAIAEVLGDLGARGRFVDLGSGWGGLTMSLAKKLPEWQVDGVEASPTPWFISNCRSIGKNTGNFRFFIDRIEKFNLRNYDVIFINMPTRNMQPLLPRLVRAMQNGALVLSHPHPLPRFPDTELLENDHGARIYVYNGARALESAGLPTTYVPGVAKISTDLEANNQPAEQTPASQSETEESQAPSPVRETPADDTPAPAAVSEPSTDDVPEQGKLALYQTD